jgi:hypothetical protein
MKGNYRLTTMGSKGLSIVTLLTLTFLGACHNGFDKDDENRRSQAKKAPAQISVENGQTVLTIDMSTQNRLGLEIATLPAWRCETKQQMRRIEMVCFRANWQPRAVPNQFLASAGGCGQKL